MVGLYLSKFGLISTRRLALLFLATSLVSLSTGCLHRHRRRGPIARRIPSPTQPGAKPATAPIVQGEEGVASWYGRPFDGRRTASGEIYNMYDMTAAHRTLPFGTQVRVHDLENGHDVVVRINDRGPFVEGRIIDLSFAAAQALHMPSSALVQLEILNLASEGSQGGVFAVQVGSFKDPNNAERLKGIIGRHFSPVIIQGFDRGNGYFYRVRVGRESTEAAAQDLARRLRQASVATETFVVRLN